MKTVAFDRVVIDEANRVPEVISLAAIVKSIKKVYLIGDPRLPRA
jgi:superfamily I DNA and/or RNA helicase